MAADYIIQMQEQEVEEQRERNAMRNAAIFILKGSDRKSAKQRARGLEYEQSEAMRNNEVILSGENDEIIEGFFDSALNDPSTEGMNKFQIEAIYRELFDEEGISYE